MDYYSLKSIDYGKFARSLKASLADNAAASVTPLHVYCAAFALWTFAQNQDDPYVEAFSATTDEFEITLNKNLHPAVKKQVLSRIGECEWSGADFLSKKNKYSHEQANAYLLFSEALEGESGSPAGLVNLASQLLDPQEGEDVADLGCGEGFFLSSLAAKTPKATLIGADIQPESVLVTQIRMLVAASFAPESPLAQRNSQQLKRVRLLSMFSDDVTMDGYDKIFSNYPWSIKTSDLEALDPENSSIYLEDLKNNELEYELPASSDWVFNRLLVDALKPGGKAVGLMTNGGIANAGDLNVRRYFVDNGLVEGIISLPEKLFPYTAIPTSLIVLGHGNETVRFVDATDLCQKGRRTNTLDDAFVEQILQAYRREGEEGNAVSVSLQDIAKADYSLAPSRYLAQASLENARPFGSVIKAISRGGAFKAAELDALSTHEPSNIHYLATGDLEDGQIRHPLLKLTDLDDKRKSKYSVKNNNLIITRSHPFKAAVAEVSAGQTIIANANLFVLDLDDSLADPYYLAAFFNGSAGQALLSRIAVGTSVLTLSVESLKDLPVPLPSLEKQREIAQAYREKTAELADLRQRLSTARKELSQLFDTLA